MKLELPRIRIHRISAISAVDRVVLINRHPGPDELDISIDTTIAFTIADLGNDGIDGASTRVWVNGALAFDTTILPDFDGPRSFMDLSGDHFTIVLDPLVPLQSESNVTVRVVSATRGGGRTIDESYSFSIEDRTSPQIVAAQAIGPKSIRIEFNEDMKVTDPFGFHFVALQVPAVPIFAVEATVKQSIVEVVVNTEMTPAVQYEVTISGVVDLNDNQLEAPFDSVRFMGFRPAVPAGRRFRLWEMIPKHNRREDDTGDLGRFVACLQEITDLLLAELDRFPDIFDIERAPETFLDLILIDLGKPFVFELNALQKARLAAILVELYQEKGTEKGALTIVSATSLVITERHSGRGRSRQM